MNQPLKSIPVPILTGIVLLICLSFTFSSGKVAKRELGYPKAIKIEEAVAEFNARAKQDFIGKTQPPLTAEEVISSIHGWLVTFRWEDKRFEKNMRRFQAVAKSGIIPKGAYLDFVSHIKRNGFESDVWRIQLDLDVNIQDGPKTKKNPFYRRIIRLRNLKSWVVTTEEARK